MIRILCFIITVCFFCSGCSPYKSVSKEIRHGFVNRFNTDTINKQLTFNINGYYQMYKSSGTSYGYGKTKVDVDSIPINMLFFKDGTFTYNFFFKEEATEKEIRFDFNSNVIVYQNQIKVSYWGIYRIEEDTIIAQYLNRPGKLIPWIFIENRFKIIDNNTLQFIHSTPVLQKDIDNHNPESWSNNIEKYSLAKFYEVDTLPPPRCWLKEEKWLWENEGDWENYMKSIGK